MTVWWRVLLGVLMVLVAAGCTTESTSGESSTDAQQDWPAEKVADLRFQWSAEPDVDLATGWPVPLRAYFESWLLTYYTGETSVVYPGFTRATPPALPKDSLQDAGVPPPLRDISGFRGGTDLDNSDVKIAGNEGLHVLRMEPIPAGFRAIVCDSRFGVFRNPVGTSTYEPAYPSPIQRSAGQIDHAYMWVFRIEFTDEKLSSPPAAPTAPQRGPLPAPRDDVFGPWFVTGAGQYSSWWNVDHPGATGAEGDRLLMAADDEENALRGQCLDRLGVPGAQRTRLATTVLDAPPELEPPVPGWPR